MTEAENHIAKVKSKHGEYVIELIGNIIRVDGKGIVTKQILQQYHDDVRKVTRSLKGKPWCFMGFVAGTGILTPEAENALVASIMLRKRYGMTACALVTKDADIPMLVKSQFERVYTHAQINYAFCLDETEALVYLKKQGGFTSLS